MVETQLKPQTSAPTLRSRLAQRKKRLLGSAVALLLAGLFTVFGTGSAAADPEKCNWYDIGCTLGQAAGSVASTAVGGTFEKIVKSMLEAQGKILEMSLSWWLAIPSPKLDPRGSVGVLATVRDYTFQLQIIGLMVSLVLVGIRMAMSRKGLVEESEQAWMALVRAVFGSTLFATFVVAMSAIGDAFSNWVLKDAVLKGDSAAKVMENLGLAVMASGPGAGIATAGIGLIALFGFLGGLLQVVLLVIRQVMLIVVVSFVPIAATWSGTGPGSQLRQAQAVDHRVPAVQADRRAGVCDRLLGGRRQVGRLPDEAPRHDPARDGRARAAVVDAAGRSRGGVDGRRR